jgi:hypothetical protein
MLVRNSEHKTLTLNHTWLPENGRKPPGFFNPQYAFYQTFINGAATSYLNIKSSRPVSPDITG